MGHFLQHTAITIAFHLSMRPESCDKISPSADSTATTLFSNGSCVSRQSSFGRCQQKHVLLLNILTCLSILVDMNPNVKPPLKPGQLYLVDGGFSTQLSKYLGSETVDGDPLWTARSLIDSPDTVCRVHRDFLASR